MHHPYSSLSKQLASPQVQMSSAAHAFGNFSNKTETTYVATQATDLGNGDITLLFLFLFTVLNHQ